MIVIRSPTSYFCLRSNCTGMPAAPPLQAHLGLLLVFYPKRERFSSSFANFSPPGTINMSSLVTVLVNKTTKT